MKCPDLHKTLCKKWTSWSPGGLCKVLGFTKPFIQILVLNLDYVINLTHGTGSLTR